MSLGQQLRSRAPRTSRPRRQIRAWIRVWVPACVLSFTLAACWPCLASDSPLGLGSGYSGDLPLEMTADEILYESERELYVAEGHVRVTQGEGRIEADWVAFSTQTRRGVAVGNVVIVDDEQVLEARFVDFNIDTARGVVFEGRFDTGPGGFKVGAEQLRKTGERSYHLECGVFTTCRCPDEDDREPWKIVAGEADVRLGGYAKVKNATLDVLGIPTLWFPWMMFPVKSERETGVLLPDVGVSGRNGFEIGLPLFWAARHNVNVMLTPRYLQKRGVQSELEIDTVYGRRSETQLYGSFIHDQNKDDFDEPNAASYSRNRWAVDLWSDTELPAKWQLRADINAVSDNYYIDDFDGFRRFRADRFLESRAFAFRHFGDDGRIALTGYATHADDLQDLGKQWEDLDRDPFLLQRLGALRFDALSARPRWLAGFVTNLGVELVNFHPRDRPQETDRYAPGEYVDGNGSFVDVGIDAISSSESTPPNPADPAKFFEGDGQFQEGEPLADYGLRLVLHPRIAYPLRLWDRVEVYPEVGYQETLYRSRERGFEERGLLTARVDVSTHLYRDFDLPLLPPTTHVLEPKFSWALVQQREQRDNPMFVPRSFTPQRRVRQLDLDNVILDPSDRIEAANIVKLGLGNRLYVGGGSGKIASLRSEFELSGLYDFSNRGAARLLLDGRSLYASRVRSIFSVLFDPKRGRLDEALLHVDVPLPRIPPVLSWSVIGGDYRYLRQIPLFYDTVARDQDQLSQITGYARVGLGSRWALGYTGVYSLDQKSLIGNLGFLEYTSKCRCWAIRAEFSDGPRRGFEFNLRYTLLGLGDKSGGAFGGGGGISSGELGRSGRGLP